MSMKEAVKAYIILPNEVGMVSVIQALKTKFEVDWTPANDGTFLIKKTHSLYETKESN